MESLHAFVAHCTEELIWLNEREEEEIAFDWSDSNPNMNAKRELYNVSAGGVGERKHGSFHHTQERSHKIIVEIKKYKSSFNTDSSVLPNMFPHISGPKMI